MKLLVIISEDVHIVAVRQARQVGREQPLATSLLNAPLDVEMSGWIDQTWDDVEGALSCAYREGIDAARPLIEKASAAVKQLATKFGKRSDAVRAVIDERLNTYLETSINAALQRVRPTIMVGGSEMRMTNVTVQQKVSLSGSLKASLTEVCQFVAGGEISLSTEYSGKDHSPSAS